tara:strand:- start:231 stop:449 length:219 start_codon:yes stop_codon:yes gene_type:complete
MKSDTLYWFLIFFNIALITLIIFSLIMYEREGFHPIINSQINKQKRKIKDVKKTLNGGIINVKRKIRKFLTF